MPRYPFSPDVLDSLPEELAELFRGLELTLLKEICSRLRLADQLNEVTVQDIRALRSHGIDIEDIKKAIRDVTGISQKKLDKLLDEVVERNQQYYTEMVTLADVTTPQTLVDEEDIWAIYEQTRGELRNITRSMGFVVRDGRHWTMLKPAKAYQHCLDSALLQVQSGAIDYNTAIRNAVRELADSGLKTVDYESGHVDQIDVAARRAVMTGVNQINAKYREQSMDYLETDLVEVSAHLGARNIPGPNGWEAHTEWQGKVYRWNRNGEQAQKPQDEPHKPPKTEPVQTPAATPKAPVQRRTEPDDVTEEYLQNATPGVGAFMYDNDFNPNEHPNEDRMAKWIHNTFGGDIRVLEAVNKNKIQTPDYLWRGKLWDLKDISTEQAANSAVRKGIHQIAPNPGGVILNCGTMVPDLPVLLEAINKRMKWYIKPIADIMIVSCGKLVRVFRYK